MQRILLVEDEPTNMVILSAYLKKAGYRVDAAEDGSTAWNKLSSHVYDLVVTDRYMPHLDGLELYARMQTSPRLRQVPVIMQTAADSPEEIVEGIEAGVYYYLTKPYREETLLTLVRAALHARNQLGSYGQGSGNQYDALHHCVQGTFEVRTPQDATNVAYLLGSLFPKPDLASIGLYELLINAVEHGNLGIGYEGKGKLLAASAWEEEITIRLDRPENARKVVRVQFRHQKGALEVTIEDEGLGFNWQPFLEIEPSRATQGNGRGIAKARILGFDDLSFIGTGNRVQVKSYLPQNGMLARTA